MQKTAVFLVLLVCLAFPVSGRALELAPFYVRNQSPLVQIFGLPPATGGRLAAPGRTVGLLATDLASHFTHSAAGNESLLFDGESYRFTLALRHGLGERFEVGAELPYLMYRGGFLDSFIIHWHDFFGFPQNGRDQAPNNRLLFSYTDDGKERLHLQRNAEGIGDLRLTGGWQIWRQERSALALRASLKLPTGDSDRLLGSGSTDLALWLAGDHGFIAAGGKYAVFGAGGAMLLTDGDILPDRQRNVVGFGTLGGGWQPLAWLAFKLQADGHTPFFDSDLPQLGESLQLTLGGTLSWAETALDLGVSEDIDVDTAPDVVFHLALRSTF